MKDLTDEAYEKWSAANREWMKEHAATATGDDVRASMRLIFRAVVGPYLRSCLSPLGCDCPSCIERYGPIHRGNVGKDLRSNPTGQVNNPRGP